MKIGRLHVNRIGRELVAGWDAGERSRYRRDLGFDRQAPRDEESLVGMDGTREMIRQKLSDARRNNPIVSGVGTRLARFLVGGTGVNPQSHSRDRDWGERAEAWWARYGQDCDSRGRLTMREIQALAVSSRPIQGGIYLERLASGLVRPIECERIRQPVDAKLQREFVDGVKVDPDTGRVIRYCIHARDEFGQFGGRQAVAYRDAAHIMSFAAPVWRLDQVRELPDLAPIVPALQDIGDMLSYTLNTSKTQSKLVAFLQKSGLGGASNSLPRGQKIEMPNGKRQTWEMAWGEVLEGYPGDDLKLLSAASPSTQHMPFVDFWLKICAQAIDFPYEFLSLDFSKADWSRMRGILLMINHALRPWQAWLAAHMQDWWTWRVGIETMPGGALFPAPDDWADVEWQGPEEVWLDRQETAQADALEWQMGLGTMSRACKRRGRGDLRDALTEKAEEILLSHEIEDEKGLPRGTLLLVEVPGQHPAQDLIDENKGEDADEGDDTIEGDMNSWVR